MSGSDTLLKLGGMLAGAFGDRAIIGFLMGLLDDVTPEEFYYFIKEKKDLLGEVSEEDWEKYGQMARQADIGEITTERIITEFKKYHPDFSQILVNQPGAMEWLDGQVVKIKQKLGV